MELRIGVWINGREDVGSWQWCFVAVASSGLVGGIVMAGGGRVVGVVVVGVAGGVVGVGGCLFYKSDAAVELFTVGHV